MTSRLPVPDGGRGMRTERKRLENRKRAADAALIGSSEPLNPTKLLKPGYTNKEENAVIEMWQ